MIQKIEQLISEWTQEINFLKNNQNIKALFFGIQKVYDGFEIYLSGHDFHDKEDSLWILDEKWEPKNNYQNLGKKSLDYKRLELYDIYRNAVKLEIENKKTIYNKFEQTYIGLSDGKHEIAN